MVHAVMGSGSSIRFCFPSEFVMRSRASTAASIYGLGLRV